MFCEKYELPMTTE